ncbi:hypothetical protein LQZ21_05000 [Treponema sp. TIM-1]|uniref:hypothetical protein n=1 Tax=Treponema sp. TIM-1 TaxID=2898417 RepID=UPI003980E5F4
MKKWVFVVLCLVVLCGLGFSEIVLPPGAENIPEVKDAMKDLENAEREMSDMMDSFVRVFPDAATQQNIEPRAWIGYLIQNPYPEITKKSGKVTRELPHFTIGFLNVGAGLMKTDNLNKVGKILSGDDIIPFPMLPLPSISIDARIGGIKTAGVNLPFDLGFSFFTLDLGSLLGSGDSGIGLRWTNWGLDARYLIIKQNGAIPNVSANLGYARWALNLDTEYFDGELSTNTVYFGGQASYTLGGFFIPYLGLKMMTGKNKGTITLTVPVPANPANITEINATLGPEKSFFQMQFFGGFGFDWLVFQTSLGASINVFTGTPGLNFTTKFSL